MRRGRSVASSERASARLLAAALSGVEPTEVAELPEGVVVVETEGDVLVVLVDSPACATPIRPKVAATANDRIVCFMELPIMLLMQIQAVPPVDTGHRKAICGDAGPVQTLCHSRSRRHDSSADECVTHLWRSVSAFSSIVQVRYRAIRQRLR